MDMYMQVILKLLQHFKGHHISIGKPSPGHDILGNSLILSIAPPQIHAPGHPCNF
jgi:hypothetical protein